MISKLYEKKVLPKLCNCCCALGPIQKQREKVVPLAEGVVLEIGIGSGLNIPFYNKDKLSKLIGLDPSEELNEMALGVAKENNLDVEFIISGAEKIILDDDSVDTVLITYTLCTIKEVNLSLKEMKRVLKPNGKVIFCEHGRSPNFGVKTFQNMINPIWGLIFGGCNVNRDIPNILTTQKMKIIDLEKMYLPNTPKFIGYNFWGTAINAED